MGDVVHIRSRQKAPWPRRGINKLRPEGPWLVPSKSRPGAYQCVRWCYDARMGVYMTCTCEIGQRRGRMASREKLAAWPGEFQACCRHVLEVNRAEADDGYAELAAAVGGDMGRFVD